MKRMTIITAAILIVATSLLCAWDVGPTPDQAVFHKVRDTFIGTEHGSICVRVWEEVDPNYGVPEHAIPSYEYQGTIVTGEPGKLIATQYYLEVKNVPSG